MGVGLKLRRGEGVGANGLSALRKLGRCEFDSKFLVRPPSSQRPLHCRRRRPRRRPPPHLRSLPHLQCLLSRHRHRRRRHLQR